MHASSKELFEDPQASALNPPYNPDPLPLQPPPPLLHLPRIPETPQRARPRPHQSRAHLLSEAPLSQVLRPAVHLPPVPPREAHSDAHRIQAAHDPNHLQVL
jgi:hypothetical protein